MFFWSCVAHGLGRVEGSRRSLHNIMSMMKIEFFLMFFITLFQK